MPPVHSRVQHPVGQGSFHSGSLSVGDAHFRYVYDCGAMWSYAGARDREIDAFKRELGADRHLDVLFVSHAHADHVNGIPRLLDGMTVDFIVLPLLTTEERLAACARSLSADPAAPRDSFYLDFIRDPEAALSRFDPGRILRYRPGEPSKRVPGAGGEGIDFDEVGTEPLPPRPGRLRWKLVGPEAHGVEGPPGEGLAEVGIPHSTAFVVDLAGGWGTWLLAPYVPPGLTAGRAGFVAALRGVLGMGDDIPFDQGTLLELLGPRIRDLENAYLWGEWGGWDDLRFWHDRHDRDDLRRWEDPHLWDQDSFWEDRRLRDEWRLEDERRPANERRPRGGRRGADERRLRDEQRRRVEYQLYTPYRGRAWPVRRKAHINVTSLCLYSGPVGQIRGSSATLTAAARRSSPDQLFFEDVRNGWLGTGDAVLKVGQQVDDLVRHFGEHLRRVATLALPHHGSDGNVDGALLTHVQATRHVAAADSFGDWRHPGSRTVQRVASLGARLSVATSSELSRVMETVL